MNILDVNMCHFQKKKNYDEDKSEVEWDLN